MQSYLASLLSSKHNVPIYYIVLHFHKLRKGFFIEFNLMMMIVDKNI